MVTIELENGKGEASRTEHFITDCCNVGGLRRKAEMEQQGDGTRIGALKRGKPVLKKKSKC